MSDSKQVTWGGRFSDGPSDLMLRFSESVSFDARLAKYDVAVNKAHSAMLAKVGILSKEEKDAIHEGLDRFLKRLEKGEIQWDPALEDVHMNIEQALTKEVPAAAKMHTGRSRNDQIATDMRLFLKEAAAQIRGLLKDCLEILLEKAKAFEDVMIPGYTHLQRAQPVSAAHHLLAYMEMFARDYRRFGAVWEEANECPLGSGALAGSTLPLDREETARLLGFVDDQGKARLTANSMDAISDRDVFLDFAQAAAVCGIHFSRLAEDFILWSSSEFNLLVLPDAFCTGSSLMPQKKNPDAMELLRGKSARLQGNLQTLMVLCKGLPLTYNRDLQEDKPPVFDSYDHLFISLEVLGGCLEGMDFRRENCARAVADPLLLATDLADYLVQQGVAFRRAHHLVGTVVAMAEKANVPIDQLPEEQVRGLDEAFGVDWRDVFSLERARKERRSFGSPGRVPVRDALLNWETRLQEL
ncbi:MAG: argininosuccinate lyase [Opitutales bacterium]|nr:argininosuccinate lyase [Opitutales bacterium]MCH8540426.1 argininosuccinate lyase [Opitutales bacterium]